MSNPSHLGAADDPIDRRSAPANSKRRAESRAWRLTTNSSCSRMDASVSGDGINADLARAVPFGLLPNELVANVCKHAFARGASGELRISLRQHAATVHLRVSDTGVGLAKGFDERTSPVSACSWCGCWPSNWAAPLRSDRERGTTVEVSVPAPTAL